jgi:hypothetical protein
MSKIVIPGRGAAASPEPKNTGLVARYTTVEAR